MYSDDKREAFFTEVHEKYHKRLERICLAYVEYNEEFRSLIDESIQETYLTAIKQYKHLKDNDNLEGWIVTTCYNRFTTAVRKYRRHKAHHSFSMDDEEKAPQLADTANAVESWWKQEASGDQIKRILDALNEREARVFHEYFEQQHSLTDVAQSQNTTVSAIKSILVRIRRKARDVKDTNFLFFLLTVASFSMFARFIK